MAASAFSSLIFKTGRGNKRSGKRGGVRRSPRRK